MLTLTRHTDAHAFRAVAEPYLMRQEACNCLPLGLLHTLTTQPDVHPTFYGATVAHDDQIVAVALMTPPFGVILSQIDDAAAFDLIARDVYPDYPAMPTVMGRKADAQAFADIWGALSGRGCTVEMNERIYELTRVRPPEGIPGAMRAATLDDFDRIMAWYEGFHHDAFSAPFDAERTARLVRARLAPESPSGLAFWLVDGEPVSMLGYSGRTPNGIRIGPVYTPPPLRGRGYASALVAHASQMLLDRGVRACFLFTDLANPTSNHIYQQVGYAPVCDVDQLRFAAAT